MTTTLQKALSYNTSSYSINEPPSKLLNIIAVLQSAYNQPKVTFPPPSEKIVAVQNPITQEWFNTKTSAPSTIEPTNPPCYIPSDVEINYLKRELESSKQSLRSANAQIEQLNNQIFILKTSHETISNRLFNLTSTNNTTGTQNIKGIPLYEDLSIVVNKLRIRNERKRIAITKLNNKLNQKQLQIEKLEADLKYGPSKESFDRVQQQYNEYIVSIQKDFAKKLADSENIYERLFKQYSRQTETIISQTETIANKDRIICNLQLELKTKDALDKTKEKPDLTSTPTHGKISDIEQCNKNNKCISNAKHVAKALRAEIKREEFGKLSDVYIVSQLDQIIIELDHIK